jgi:hypothetical protein
VEIFITMKSQDLNFIQEALQDVLYEYDHLEGDLDWYVADCRSKVEAALSIIKLHKQQEILKNEDTAA